jgi:hypothetical protein
MRFIPVAYHLNPEPLHHSNSPIISILFDGTNKACDDVQDEVGRMGNDPTVDHTPTTPQATLLHLLFVSSRLFII